MVARLQKIDPIPADEVDEPVFLREPAGPGTGREVFERFRLADTLKRVAEYCLYQVQRSQSGLPIGHHPISKILPEFGVKDRRPAPAAGAIAGFFGQAPSHDAVARRIPA